MDARQAFKLAFLRRCAERGLTLTEIERLTDRDKQAAFSDWLPSLVPAAAGGAIAGAPGAAVGATLGATVPPSYVLPSLFGSAALLGGGAGYAAGVAHDSLTDQSPEELKQRDIINRYSLATQKAQLLDRLAQQRRQSAGRKAHWRA